MTRSHRFALLSGVALPVLLAGSLSGTAEQASAATQIVVAQADGLAAAQAEVAAAQAALEEAQANGGDVAAAQARLDAALNALAAAEAATESQPETPSQAETPAQPQPPQQQDAGPAETQTPAEPPAAESAPAPQAPPQTPAAEQAPPRLPPPEQPAPQAQGSEPSPTQRPQTSTKTPPAPEEAPPQSPAAELPPVPPESPTPPAAEQPAQTRSEPQPAEQPAQAEVQPETQAPPEESAVESQLEAQGDQKAVENVRSLRDKLRQEFARGEPDGSTEDARGGDSREDGRSGERGDDRDRRHRDRPPSDEGNVVLDFGLGFVVELGDQLVIRRDSTSESERFLDRARDVDVERFRGGYTRTVVTRRDGTRIYTVRNRYGDIITRTRVSPNGHQVVLIDNRDFYRDGRQPRYGRYDHDLPPLRVDIPREQYVVETSRYGRDDIRTALMAPPVEAVEHPYSLEDIRTNRRLRDKLRRVDLNTITFDFGSAAISPSQFEALAVVGTAIEDILKRSPDELFLVEGYTDAVGTPTANLILSDQRAEAIAVALSSNFDIPPENLITQGYGEQYLKVPTQEAERENRRVTLRRITPLVAQAGVTAQ